MYTSVYIHTYMYIYVYMHIYTYIYNCIHIFFFWSKVRCNYFWNILRDMHRWYKGFHIHSAHLPFFLTFYWQHQKHLFEILTENSFSTRCNTLQQHSHWRFEPFCQHTLQHIASHSNTLQLAAKHGNTLHYAATCCNTLASTPCNTLQRSVPLHHHASATRCNMLQHAATCCNTLQRTATHCNALQYTATHCDALQRTATHCNTVITADSNAFAGY